MIYLGALILYDINKSETLCCYDRSVHFLQNKCVEKDGHCTHKLTFRFFFKLMVPCIIIQC